MNLLWVTLAGALGCVVRFLFEYVVRMHHPTKRPWATAFANALGCGIAGWGAYRLVGTVDMDARAILLTGFCGGLTTFSSAFAIPVLLVREHHWGFSASLIIATPLFCAGFFAIGMAIAH